MSASRGARFVVVTLAALASVALTVALGVWQLHRAHEKLALHDAMVARRAEPPVDMAALLVSPDPAALLHRRITLRGHWDAPHTVYLDNRQMRGLPGFYVVTPLRLQDGRAVLVQRGWVQRNFEHRETLPRVDTPAGEVEVTGHIEPPPSRLFEFHGAPEVGPIRQNLDLAAFRTETGLALLDMSVVQTGDPGEGLLREWPEPATGVERHYGYMVQWWAIAAVILFLYVRYQLIVPRREAPHA